jgi:hypothetical protein
VTIVFTSERTLPSQSSRPSLRPAFGHSTGPSAGVIRRGVLGLAVGVGLLLAAGCGGEKPASTPTPSATVDHNAHATASGTPAVSIAPTGFCADWFKLAAESARFSAAQNATPAQPEVLRSSVEATTSYLKTLAGSAPADIKTDFTTYAQWWTDFSVQMTRVNYDFSKVASDPELQKQMQATTEPKFAQASAKISAWVSKNCNVLR